MTKPLFCSELGCGLRVVREGDALRCLNGHKQEPRRLLPPRCPSCHQDVCACLDVVGRTDVRLARAALAEQEAQAQLEAEAKTLELLHAGLSPEEQERLPAGLRHCLARVVEFSAAITKARDLQRTIKLEDARVRRAKKGTSC